MGRSSPKAKLLRKGKQSVNANHMALTKLQQVLEKLDKMDEKIEGVMAKVVCLEKAMNGIQSEPASLKNRPILWKAF